MHLPGVKSQGVGTLHCSPKAIIEVIVQSVMVARTARVDQRMTVDGVTDVTSHDNEIFAKQSESITSIWLA